MLSTEELTKQIKLITQNAWRQETNTTVNSIVEYVVREAMLLLNDELNDELLELKNTLKDLTDASTDGGISQPQRNSQTQDKSSRKSAKAGQVNGADAVA